MPERENTQPHEEQPPYREETRRVLEMMLEVLSKQAIDGAFLEKIHDLIAKGQMDDVEAIMALLKQWPLQEGEDEPA